MRFYYNIHDTKANLLGLEASSFMNTSTSRCACSDEWTLFINCVPILRHVFAVCVHQVRRSKYILMNEQRSCSARYNRSFYRLRCNGKTVMEVQQQKIARELLGTLHPNRERLHF